MERYSLQDFDPPGSVQIMLPDPNGKWVKATEAEARVAELETRIRHIGEWNKHGANDLQIAAEVVFALTTNN